MSTSGKILVFKHFPTEGPGRLLDCAKSYGLEMETVSLMEGEPIPPHQDYVALVAMGGPMNVYQEELYPWLAEETRYIADWVRKGKPYLGICLGGQLLAKAIGGRVTTNPRKEIGNFTVELTPQGISDPVFSGFAPQIPVFQWHGDTFSELSEGQCLASSAQCAHQAFRVGQVAYGLQFHIELTMAMAQEWLTADNLELIAEKLDPVPILAQFREQEAEYDRSSKRLFTNFLRTARIID